MKKLKDFIKGYKNCRNVRIIYNGKCKCEWNGSSIYHIIERYCSDLLDHEVENTSVTFNGTREIFVKDYDYIALENGEEVFRGSYDECMHKVGQCNAYGWYLPMWADCGIIRA